MFSPFLSPIIFLSNLKSSFNFFCLFLSMMWFFLFSSLQYNTRLIRFTSAVKWIRYVAETGWHPLLLGRRLWAFFRVFSFGVSVMPVKRSIREFAVTSTFPIRNCILQVFNYGKHLSSIFKHKNSNSYKIFTSPWQDIMVWLQSTPLKYWSE